MTTILRSIWNYKHILWFACRVGPRALARTALIQRMDYAYGQQVLEEDYDENYEPTEEGMQTRKNSNSLREKSPLPWSR